MTIGRVFSRTEEVEEVKRMILKTKRDITTLIRTIDIFRGILKNEKNVSFQYRIEDDIQNLHTIILDRKYIISQLENYKKRIDTSIV